LTEESDKDKDKEQKPAIPPASPREVHPEGEKSSLI
jgi:hypothetical protein